MDPMQKTQKLDGPLKYQKSVPSVCTNCSKVYSINKLYAEDGKQVGITHGLCEACFESIQNGTSEAEADSQT